MPLKQRRTTTVTAASRTSGLIATTLLDGATNSACFCAYIVETQAPVLRQDDTVILNKLPANNLKGVRKAVKAVGAWLLYLPPNNPDLLPFELSFAKLKSMLRTDAKRTVHYLCDAILAAFASFTTD